MRVEHGFLGLAIVTAAVATVMGCGSSVTETANGGKGGTDTGTTTFTVPTGTTTSVTTGSSTGSTGTASTGTTTTTSTTTSNNPKCDAACQHIDSCNLGVSCSQLPQLDCNTIGPQYDCLLDCLTNTQCSQIGFNTFQTCQGQCAGDGGPGTDGGTGQSCQQCAIQACGTQSFACGQNQTCQQWLGCVGQCEQAQPPDPACPPACDAQFPGAKALFDPLYTCAWACAGLDPCNHK
jgi:hypothetical protein